MSARPGDPTLREILWLAPSILFLALMDWLVGGWFR